MSEGVWKELARIVKGIVKGGVVVLREKIPLPEELEVEVHIPEEVLPKKGSPEALLQLRGMLTKEEAEEILKAIKEVGRKREIHPDE